VILDGDDLSVAVSRPRLHVDIRNGGRVAVEPGVELGIPNRQVLAYDRPHMYFGAVGAAHRRPDGTLEAVTDARRNGVAFVI
jgi:gamma-glutamyltranspeptidase